MASACGSGQTRHASSAPDYGARLERFDYPFPVRVHTIEFAGDQHEMVYMDVSAGGAAGAVGTVVLLHGKNFSGAYWERTSRDLSGMGYRVVVPDQLGFGKSSKPVRYQYSFAGLASNTKSLLDALGVDEAVVVGHSMGGMLATRFALMYPEVARELVLVNPIGLEDWGAKGVPYRGLEEWYERELNKTAEGIKRYQLESYYDGDWEPEYQRWVDMLAGMTAAEDYADVAAVQAQTYDMIYTQPVVGEFEDVRARTLLIIGQRDRTALGKDLVDDALRAELGDYPELGRSAAASIAGAQLVELDGVGHLPHIEAYERFWRALEGFLSERE